jgi:hypothetical protein
MRANPSATRRPSRLFLPIRISVPPVLPITRCPRDGARGRHLPENKNDPLAVLACLAGLAGRRPKAAAAALAELVHRRGFERASEVLTRSHVRETRQAEGSETPSGAGAGRHALRQNMPPDPEKGLGLSPAAESDCRPPLSRRPSARHPPDGQPRPRTSTDAGGIISLRLACQEVRIRSRQRGGNSRSSSDCRCRRSSATLAQCSRAAALSSSLRGVQNRQNRRGRPLPPSRNETPAAPIALPRRCYLLRQGTAPNYSPRLSLAFFFRENLGAARASGLSKTTLRFLSVTAGRAERAEVARVLPKEHPELLFQLVQVGFGPGRSWPG